MPALVECDTAIDRDGNEIHIRDAASGAKGYFCRSCGAELVAHRKRRRNEDHFQHRARFTGEVFDCIWSNESYRHKVAKRIVRLLRQLKVPALYAIRPEDYEGPLPKILEATVFTAHRVLEERCVYEDIQGHPCFARYLYYEQAPEGKELLVRPDLTFCNDRLEPVLFVEICVTHTPDDKKLARLQRLKVPTLEIQIPQVHSEKELERFLTHFTTHSRWLYHPQQYVYQPDPNNPLYAGRRGRVSAANKRRLLGFESVKCRSIRVEDALRGVRKFLEGTDHAERRAAASIRFIELGAEESRLESIVREKQGGVAAEQKEVSDLIAAAETDLAPVSRAANAEVQRRVGKQRQEHRTATAALIAEERELARQEEGSRAFIFGRFNDASTDLRAKGEAEAAEFDRQEREIRAAEAELRRQYKEHDDLCREEAAIELEEASLAREEAAASANLERTQRARTLQEQAASETENRHTTAYELELKIRERKRALDAKEDQANSGRLAF